LKALLAQAQAQSQSQSQSQFQPQPVSPVREPITESVVTESVEPLTKPKRQKVSVAK
jgi:hypothetical protein